MPKKYIYGLMYPQNGSTCLNEGLDTNIRNPDAFY
jgi:hypothetical protein